MDDNEILDLYFARSEQAIVQTDQKYGFYCYSIAKRILSDPLDAEESVNDTYYSAWKLIPPRRPQRFSTFLGKIGGTVFAADQIEIELDEGLMVSASAVNALRRELLDELAECVAGSESPETELLRKELTASLNRFLRKLPEKDRTVFLLRYYYAGTKEDIARKTGLSSNQVKYILQKVRKQLADTLKKEGLQ